MRDLTEYYKKILIETASLSYCKKRKVGSIIIKEDNIISFGFNGTPSGMCNDCEEKDGTTKREVLHSESNAILKAARHGFSLKGAILYNTLSPCFDCAKLIVQSGIIKVCYMEEWENDFYPLSFLVDNKIRIQHI